MPNIFDNITDDTRLGLALVDSLKDFDTVDVATGYFDLRGWSTFADIIDTKPTPAPGARATARILVGMIAPAEPEQLLNSLQDQVQPPAYGSDIHDREKALARRDRLVKHLRTQLMRGLGKRRAQFGQFACRRLAALADLDSLRPVLCDTPHHQARRRRNTRQIVGRSRHYRLGWCLMSGLRRIAWFFTAAIGQQLR